MPNSAALAESAMVYPAGLEPTTSRLKAGCAASCATGTHRVAHSFPACAAAVGKGVSKRKKGALRLAAMLSRLSIGTEEAMK